MAAHSLLALVALVLAAALPLEAFYLPGVSPISYEEGAPVDLKVNRLTSTRTLLPLAYYQVPHCQPKEVVSFRENLGEVLRGDRIENSLYKLFMRTDDSCHFLCRVSDADGALNKGFADRIAEEYRVHAIVDNLPAATVTYYEDSETHETLPVYDRGYPLGFTGAADIEGTVEGEQYLNNHLDIRILYHTGPAFVGSRIVGFEVTPYSIKYDYKKDVPPEDASELKCPAQIEGAFQPLSVSTPTTDIVFTYSVTWTYSPIPWASRWDTYLYMTSDAQIHWFSVVNSLMIIFFLTGMVAMIMVKTLHRDLARYSQLETAEDAAEETGWKLVHGDVFRPPGNASLLSVFVGLGVQLNACAVVCVAFAALGFLSPANRGSLLTAALLMFDLCSVFAGYYSSRLYKSMRGQAWKTNTMRTAFLVPGVIFSIFLFLNFLIYGEDSSGYAPFSTLFTLVGLWFGISVPLVFVGSYYGLRKDAYEFPVRTNQIPRYIPEQQWYMKPVFMILVGGVLPFGAVLIELFFILSSLWLDQVYYVFGFTLLVFVILGVTCAEITVVFVYFQLCNEDYNWWWRSFLISGSSAIYFYLYAVHYFVSRLELDRFVSGVLYFGYMAIITIAFFLVTGTIGFLSAFYFVRAIYSSVKVS